MTPGLKKYFSCCYRDLSDKTFERNYTSSNNINNNNDNDINNKSKRKKKSDNTNVGGGALTINDSENVSNSNTFTKNICLKTENFDVSRLINNHKVYDKNFINNVGENDQRRNLAFTINVTPQRERKERGKDREFVFMSIFFYFKIVLFKLFVSNLEVNKY